MKKYLMWFLVNGIYTSFFVAGIILPSQGLLNVGVMATLILFLLSIMMFLVVVMLDEIDDITDEQHDKIIDGFTIKRTKFYNFIDHCYDWGMLSLFVFHGFWFTSIVYFLHMIIMWVTRHLAENTREEPEPDFEGDNIKIVKGKLAR